MEFSTTEFPEGIHACMIYDQDEDREKMVTDYLAAGFKLGDQVRYFRDTTAPEDLRSWLLRAGVGFPEIKEDGPFGIYEAQKVYCPSGRFDPQETINIQKARYERTKQAGYHGSRVCGEMTWALKGVPGSNRLLEYEVLLNTIVASFPHSGMCQYDARCFDGATLLNVLKVHPWMIVKGKIVQNPYFVPPEEFLKEFKSRG